ncbi:type II toxin-antitoxin system RelE family toxin [Actinomyces ruminicola]|uniref:type II toxin-antitoxin system RelE family toxin n=1 Tax=Actinomyces ruminicola TaxID=332524 RepID=UPI001FE12823|nr:type II toxin-antitoxin system RelE/ParE family toxin [Actinomyces ruminicola]
MRPAAQKALRRIDKPDQRRIQGAIALLATDPHPPGCHPLKGRPAWRVRVGNYRIIYTIDDGRLVVVVVTPEQRRDVYRCPEPPGPTPAGRTLSQAQSTACSCCLRQRMPASMKASMSPSNTESGLPTS